MTHADLSPSKRLTRRKLTVSWLSVVGIGFWFLIGFPFGNHNESYYWISLFERRSFWGILSDHTLAATFRPVGQGLAYIGWQVAGGSSWPVQVFNFGVAAIALVAIALILQETETFSVAMALAGGAYFAGFIYLFHLHGVFYSPLLVLIAAIMWMDQGDPAGSFRRELAVFVFAIAVGLLIHPYALILFFAYLVGRVVEFWRDSSYKSQALRALLVLLTAITAIASRPHGQQVLSNENLRALLTSYRLTETVSALSVVSALFAAATFLSIERMSRPLRIGLAGAAALCAAVFAFVNLPAVLVWIVAAVLKMAYLRKWSLACTTSAAALLPGIAPSGSPTYAIFAVLLSVIALAWGWVAAENALMQIRVQWAVVIILLAVLLGGALRIGVELPVVSRIAMPVLAEREKTKQMEAVIEWVLASEYRNWNVRIEGIANPVDSGQEAIIRTHRPPTFQGFLDSYLASRRGNPTDQRTLVVTFGNRVMASMTPVYRVEGRYAGAAIVFK